MCNFFKYTIGAIIIIVALISLMDHIKQNAECNKNGGAYVETASDGFVCVKVIE